MPKHKKWIQLLGPIASPVRFVSMKWKSFCVGVRAQKIAKYSGKKLSKKSIKEVKTDRTRTNAIKGNTDLWRSQNYIFVNNNSGNYMSINVVGKTTPKQKKHLISKTLTP